MPKWWHRASFMIKFLELFEMLNVKAFPNQDSQDKRNQNLDGMLICSPRGWEIENLHVLYVIPKSKFKKKRRHFCWNSILVDMCSDYNILVESWFFFVSEKHVSTFWIFFHLLFYYSQLDIWISNWWAVGYSYIQQLLIE